MSRPFIIWTLRRTGGTSVANFLKSIAGRPYPPDEPFNQDRAYGHVTRGWSERLDPDWLAREVRQLLREGPIIKHCFEILPLPISQALLRESAGFGYRHIVLDRHDEVSRLVSLILAFETGVWGTRRGLGAHTEILAGRQSLGPIDIPRTLEILERDHWARVALRESFRAEGVAPFICHYEPLYRAPEDWIAILQEALQHIEAAPEALAGLAKVAPARLASGNLQSWRISEFLPNLAELKERLGRLHASLGGRGSPENSFDWQALLPLIAPPRPSDPPPPG